MKSIKAFLKLVEIKTKVASVFPLLLGTIIAYTVKESIDLINFFIMGLSLLCIDLATTGFNHYYDYKRALLKSGYHYEEHNPISAGEIKPKTAVYLLSGIVLLGIVAGLFLVLRTDAVVLALGAVSFAVGLGYSMGPLPISRTILGEVTSGLFMGGLIPFIAFYIQLDPGMLGALQLSPGVFSASLNTEAWIPILFGAVPMILFIADIMLANNLCDAEEDILNKRYTLPVSIGRKKAVWLFKGLVYAALFSVPVAVLVKALPWTYILALLMAPKILKQTQQFAKNPVKALTFKYAVKNMLLFSLASISSLILGLFL